MFQTVPLSIIRSFSLYTQQWYMSYSLQAGSGRNCSSILILLASCQQTCMTYPKNKFEKLVHLVGFIIRIYHDAQSPECQTQVYFYFIFFLIYGLFNTLSIAGTLQCWTVGRLVHNKLQNYGKQQSQLNLRYYPDICLKKEKPQAPQSR